MLTRSLAWGVIGIVILSAAWWFWDPAGFAHNPVLDWLTDLTLRSRGYHR